MDLYQVCSNYATGSKSGPVLGVTYAYIESTFSEYGHVVNQIKGNEAYNNILAKSLLLHLPLTPGIGSKGGLVFFSE